ncbi:hypothetical protein [Nonomuraea sp. NPDC049309]|jgi:hypothetical protein|uniref:hypothetical protein n=1 Tax=Nonomuraea sp. NPDC049309 TaxID=3364350 RepID=UPI0037112118
MSIRRGEAETVVEALVAGRAGEAPLGDAVAGASRTRTIWTITLNPVKGGTARTTHINPKDFPA